MDDRPSCRGDDFIDLFLAPVVDRPLRNAGAQDEGAHEAHSVAVQFESVLAAHANRSLGSSGF
jgi:hypothetical protein